MNYAIIVAGGSGQRMNSETPKQFLMLSGKPIICHTILAFVKAIQDIEIILVLPAAHFDKLDLIQSHLNLSTPLKIVAGGNTRFHSVKNGLDAILNDEGIVFIHDAVRPIIDTNLILRCELNAEKFGNAITCISVNDTLRKIDGDFSTHVDRANYRIIQTPQTFQLAQIKKAFETEYKDTFTDDASVAEQAGYSIHLTEGSIQNIKITTPFDLQLATIYLNN
jgi:2-C-methyl-D-erythritol 4-phosphate cytidylyltransferase